MLGILVTSHLIEDFLYHDEVLATYDGESRIVFVTNNPNVSEKQPLLRHPLIRLSRNDGKHDGTFNMIARASSFFDSCDYVLHYHADQRFREVSIITDVYRRTRNQYLIASIPRQWLFDDHLKYINNGAVPFHTSFFMIRRNLLEDVFAEGRLATYKEEGKDPAMHFEAILYIGLSRHRVDYDRDVLYIENIGQMKRRFGNSPVYWNVWFEDSGITHLSNDRRRSEPTLVPLSVRGSAGEGTVVPEKG